MPRFAPDDFFGEGPLQELRLLPDAEELKPRILRRFAPQAELYLAYARAGMRMEDVQAAAAALREAGGPGRGHGGEFYRKIATNYRALTAEGEPHPVKALAEIHHVSISAASRWITEARRRGYIAEQQG